jgi:hypothetical protein
VSKGAQEEDRNVAWWFWDKFKPRKATKISIGFLILDFLFFIGL